jgi:hypothetical protein
MKKIIFYPALLALLLGSLTFNSCKKDPSPTPEPEQEEFDGVRLQFIALDDQGSETTDTTTINFSKEGVPSPAHSHLHPHESYRTLITLYYKGNAINQDIIDEGTEHQFFFLPSLDSGILDYVYNDKDADGKGIGLDGTMTIGEGEFDLKIVLRHGLDKSHPSARSWNSPDYQQAGGTDDLSITFEIHAEE